MRSRILTSVHTSRLTYPRNSANLAISLAIAASANKKLSTSANKKLEKYASAPRPTAHPTILKSTIYLRIVFAIAEDAIARKRAYPSNFNSKSTFFRSHATCLRVAIQVCLEPCAIRTGNSKSLTGETRLQSGSSISGGAMCCQHSSDTLSIHGEGQDGRLNPVPGRAESLAERNPIMPSGRLRKESKDRARDFQTYNLAPTSEGWQSG